MLILKCLAFKNCIEKPTMRYLNHNNSNTCQLMQTIGVNIRTIRKRKNLTQEDIAVMLNINR